MAAGAEFDEAAEEHDDDTDEHDDNRFHADDFAAETAGIANSAAVSGASEGLAHKWNVFLTGGEIAFDPASALGDGLSETGRLLVVEDGGVVVIS